MTIEEIKSNYAVEQGYDDWFNLWFNCDTYVDFIHHENTVIQLIQDDLKKKISNIEDIKIEHVDEFGLYIDVIGTEKETILDTENIK